MAARPETLRLLRATGVSGRWFARGFTAGYLGLIVLIPIAAVTWRSADEGLSGFWDAVSNPASVAKLTLLVSLAVVLVNVVFGTLIAWVLVRDDFRGKSFVNSLIDLPFALPTIVAGLT